MSERPDVILVNRGIIVRCDQVLLLRRSATDSHNANLWEFPGGKVDIGEDIVTGLKREVYEETGLMVAPHTGLVHAESEVIKDGRHKGKLYISLFHVAQLLSGEVQISDEHAASSWKTVDEAFDQDLAPQSYRALGAIASAGLI